MSDETTTPDVWQRAGKGARQGAAFGFGLSIIYLALSLVNGAVPDDADPLLIVGYMALKTVWMCYVMTVGYAIANDGVSGIIGGAAGGIAFINLLGWFAPGTGLLIPVLAVGAVVGAPLGALVRRGLFGLGKDPEEAPKPTERETELEPWDADT